MKKIIRLISVVLVVVFLMTMLSVVASALEDAVLLHCLSCGSQRIYVSTQRVQWRDVWHTTCLNVDPDKQVGHYHRIGEWYDGYFCEDCHYVSYVYNSFYDEKCDLTSGKK